MITTNGNINHISYRIVDMQGGISSEIEASQKKRILGPIKQIQLIIDTAEAGLNVFVHRFLAPGAFLSAIDVLVPETATSNQQEQLDSTTASIASGAAYTGAFVLIPTWATGIQIVTQIARLTEIKLDWSDDGTAVIGRWVAWGGPDFVHNVAIRAKYVRLVITNPGVNQAGTAAQAVTPTTAKIYAVKGIPLVKNVYRFNALELADLTASGTFGQLRSPTLGVADINGVNMEFYISVIGAVTGTTPTLTVSADYSPDGLDNVGTADESTALTATDTFQNVGQNLSKRILAIGYAACLWTVTGTTPVFNDVFLSVTEVLDP
mgnify:CR=1 FL=1